MNRDGSEPRVVVFIESFPRLGAPRWSHDQARLVFDAQGAAQRRVLVVDVTGRNLIDLGAGACPDWSPDDKQVVFEVPNVGRAGVWVQNADGQGNTWLATGRAPRFSPDGSQLALCAPLRILDVHTGRVRAVFNDGERPDGTFGCEWSPDGKRLAACVLHDNGRELILIPTDPAAAAPRVRLRADLRGAPAWSPDGKHLALTIYDAELKARRLYLVDVEGDDPPRLIPGQDGDNYDPAWSPDGKRLAFASTRHAAPE
jgi:Tol biopolymer transport system component